MPTAKIDMKSFHGAYVAVKQHHAAIRAQELAAWLKHQDTPGLPRAPESIAGQK